MFNDEFKKRYTTIPFAIYKAYCTSGKKLTITHQHREIELIAITEGTADFYVNSQKYEMKKGDSLIIPPYALHRAHSSASEPTSYYCICFDLDLICDEWLKRGLETGSVIVGSLIEGGSDRAEQIQKYIEKAFLACENRKPGWEMIAMGNMSLLLGLLKSVGFFVQSTKPSKDADFGKKIMEYIIANYASKISSRNIANELYMEHSSFCRTFKKTFGCCFTDYILDYRLEKAKTFLASTALPITEIAFSVGFNDCSYFCKVFKERIGTTPLSFKKSDR